MLSYTLAELTDYMSIFGQMPPAADLGTGHVNIIVMPNSLNIHFTGIHALGKLFSVKFYIT